MTTAIDQHLAYTPKAATTVVLGVSESMISKAIKSGKLRARWSDGINPETGKGRGRQLILRADLEAWLDGMAQA